jgi:hypothetical protein
MSDGSDYRLKHIEEELAELNKKIDGIDKDLTKYRGMVGGILLVITAIGVFFRLLGGFLKEHIVWP